jgi:hypothetical protein
MKYFPKTKRYIALFFPLFLVAIFYFGFGVDVAYAADTDPGFWKSVGSAIGGALLLVLNGILYGVFVVVSYPVTWAAVLLGWAVDPAAVHTLFTMNSIYLLWQMIRDFFNLFFILTLLFIAFATIFQIDSFNYKKTLGKLLLMALLVNFSFPIARFIVDATNVPMYFFMESMFTNKAQANGKGIVEVSFGSSGMQEIILPGSNNKGFVKGNSDLTVKIFTGIIFMFLFGVSLLVFAIMMVIRSIMLVILIIFSPVGFAGMVIPGFRQYATKWWDNLLKYAMFGPASMLMMLVAVKFMQEFKVDGKNAMIAQASGSTGDAASATYMATMASVVVPIILIWSAITIGQTMGIAGAGMVTQRAQQFSRWAGRRSVGRLGGDFVQNAYRSWDQSRQPARQDRQNRALSTRFGQRINQEWTELQATGGGLALTRGARRDAQNRFMAEQNRRVEEAHRRENMNIIPVQQLRQMQQQHQNDPVMNAAIVRALAERREATRDDLEGVRGHYQEMNGVPNTVTRGIEQSMLAYDPQAVHTRNGQLDEAALRADVRANGFRSATLSEDAVANSADYFRIAAEEGRLTPQNIEAIRARGDEFRDAVTNTLDATIDQFEENLVNQQGPLQPDQQRRQDTARRNLHSSFYAQTGRFHDVTASDQVSHMRAEVFSRANGDIMRRSQGQSIDDYADEIADNMPPGRVVDIIQRMFEENPEQARNLIGRLRTTAGTQGNANADAVRNMVDRQNGHNAIRHLD